MSEENSIARSIGPITPAKVEAVEGRMLQFQQVDCPLQHLFGAGICIRVVTMPAESMVVGHEHKFTDWNIMMTGRMTLLNHDGSLSELKAPQIFLGKPGRKIAWVHEDCVWLNLFTTNETDVEKVEQLFLNKSATFMLNQQAKRGVEYLEHQPDRDDFVSAIELMQMSPEKVREISENEADQIPFPSGLVNRVQVAPSPIEGRGLFATEDIKADEVIAPARINGKRTPAGRFTNHARHPNSRMTVREDGDIDLVAMRDIRGCQGGQPGEEITVCYRQAILASSERKQLCQP